MRVLIQATPDASGNLSSPYQFQISAGGRESPKDLKIRAGRNTQSFQGLRAATKSFQDRLNADVTVTFEVARLFPTVSDAESYLFLHQANCPGGGNITFYDEDGDIYYMRNAVCEASEGRHIGRSTFHTYSLMGSQISST